MVPLAYISYWQAGLGIIQCCNIVPSIGFLYWRKLRFRPLFCPATSPRFWSFLRGGSGRGTPPSPQCGAGQGTPPSPRGGASIPGSELPKISEMGRSCQNIKKGQGLPKNIRKRQCPPKNIRKLKKKGLSPGLLCVASLWNPKVSRLEDKYGRNTWKMSKIGQN